MSEPYEELVEGEVFLRAPPNERHEEICRHIHDRVAAALTNSSPTKLLSPRAKIKLSPSNHFCPDLTLVTSIGSKLWLAAEVINSGENNFDTVIKKGIYEQMKIPRLWMIDPRYNNVEIYHGNEYGITLKEILALNDVLTEPLLPSFQFPLSELFQRLPE